jgi:hypothetical protein
MCKEAKIDNTTNGADGLDCEQRHVRQDFQDLWYTVVAEPHSHYVEYKVYAIEGIGGESGEQSLWHKNGDPCSPSPVETLEEAEVFLHGSVKWDGCSNWYFDEQDRVMIHGCERDHLANIGEVMARCWDMTKELCPHWCDM